MVKFTMTQKELDDTLLKACEDGELLYIKALLVAGASINARDFDQWTPLHHAVDLGATDITKFLIDNGSDIGAIGVDGLTPADIAANHKYSNIAQMLSNAAEQQGHANRVTEERKDKGPPQVGG